MLAHDLDTSRRTETTDQGGIGRENEYFFFGLTVNGNFALVFFSIFLWAGRNYTAYP
jgi:hypothetical protein